MSFPTETLLTVDRAPADAPSCLFCTEQTYVPYTATTIASLLAHADSSVRLWVLCPDLDEGALASLSETVGDGAHSLHVVRPTDAAMATFRQQFVVRGGWSEISFLRLLIAELIPEDRALYLDSDLLVLDSITRLFTTNLGGASVAGAIDIPRWPLESDPELNWLNLPAGDLYINAGVLVMDLEKLRRESFLERATDWYARHAEQTRCAEQCIINAVLAGDKAALSTRWNLRQPSMSDKRFAERLIAGKPAIYHFGGPVKPWNEGAYPDERNIWAQYLAATPYELEAVLRPPTPESKASQILESMAPIQRAWRDTFRQLRD